MTSTYPDKIPAFLRTISPDTLRKIFLFGGLGAIGCLLGALLGEPLFLLMPRPSLPKVDIVFVLDATGSMQSQIDGVQRGIVDFAKQLSERGLDERVGLVAFRDELVGEAPDVLHFGDSPFTDDYFAFSKQVGRIRASGGEDMPESSYDAIRLASQQPFREAATRVLLLITDAPPLLPDKRTSNLTEVHDDLEHGGVSQLHLVIKSEHQNAYVPLQLKCPGEVFDLAAVAGGATGFERLLPVLGKKIAEATVRGLASSAAVDQAYAPRQLGITAIWTGLLACGVALALIAGQNHYLHKPLLVPSQAAIGLLGGMLVGSLAGGVGQILGFAPQFLPQATASTLGSTLTGTLALAGMLLGWALLGGLLGRGLAAFVPNLGAQPAIVGGTIGGLAAALGFTVMSALAGDLLGRFLGAVLLGFCIGAMIALVEAATRDFYLEVRYGLREIIRVSLGDTPVTVGSDGRACTVFAPSSPRPVLFKYWIADSLVHLLDYATERATTVSVGDERSVGTVTLTVRAGSTPVTGKANTAGSSSQPAATAPPPPPPPPPRPALARPDRPLPVRPPPPPPPPHRRP